MITVRSFFLFLIEPLFLFGIIMSIFLYYVRIKQERLVFKYSINKDCYELRHFIKQTIIYGIIFSIFSAFIGLSLPVSIIKLYEILSVISLFFLPLIDISSVPFFIIGFILVTQYINYSIVAFLLLFINYYIKYKIANNYSSSWIIPKIKNGRRGRKIVEYVWRNFSVFPLLMFIPSNHFYEILKMFPLLVSGHNINVFFLPIFIGGMGRIFKEPIGIAMSIYSRQNVFLLFMSLFLSVLSYIFPKISVFLLVILFLCDLATIIFRKILDMHSSQWYVETSLGLRIVAIRPNTPAEKMNLKIGDIILDCNGHIVNNEKQFYYALQQNPLYCHLKVKTFDGNLKITEGAIYNDSPYELGVVLFN